MCGIAGIFALGDRPIPSMLAAMNREMTHRGPDDSGEHYGPGVGLAMRRLSIIGVGNGHQPLFNETGELALVFNGELYNYQDLKADLLERGHCFSSDSDAEVPLHLYEERGLAMVEELEGMYAFALFDQRRGRLLLVRDRVGKKPLYWTRTDGLLLFASEIKAIHATGLVAKEVETRALGSYLECGYVVGRETLFRGIHKLPAGALLEAEGKRVEERRYWDFPAPVEDSDAPSLDEAAERLRSHLRRGVEKRLMSEVPLGAFLSGGVDSSAVVGLMKEAMDEPFHTFCIGFQESQLDEWPNARRAAEIFGLEEHYHELVLEGCSAALLKAVNVHNDEPAGDPAAIPTFGLSKIARQYITVVLTGEGGDELFAGYRHHQHAERLSRLDHLPGGRALLRGLARFEDRIPTRQRKRLWIAGLPAEQRSRAWLALWTDRQLQRLLRPSLRPTNRPEALAEPFRELFEETADWHPLAHLLYVDSRTTLADGLLMKVDKMTMAASLEGRCPLLDLSLIETAAALPTSYKLHQGTSRRVLRKALAPIVPRAILEQKKRGFDVPLGTWLRGELSSFVRQALLAPDAAISELIEPSAVAELHRSFETHPDDDLLARQLWRLLNLAVWLELHWPSGRLPELAEAPIENAMQHFRERSRRSSSTAERT